MKKPYTIVIAHQKGGVGKSTIASSLAVELSKKYNLTVLDLDKLKSLTYFNSVRKNSNLKPLNILHANTIDELKNLINNNKDILLIDVGGFDSDVNRIAILGGDLIITPVSDSGIEQAGLLSFKEILNQIRKHRKDLTAHILLNRIHPSASTSLQELYDFINEHEEFSKLDTIIRDRTEYKRAYESGISVIEQGGKAATEMNNLVLEIIKNGKN
jgi:chromosome partitioning protein